MSGNRYGLLTVAGAWILAGGFPLRAEEAFTLSDPGTETIVRYEKYGRFGDRGSSDYRYYIEDREGLSRAVGEGVYPNVTGLLKDPAFQKMQYEKKLEGSVWDYVNASTPQAGFYKWASNRDQPAGLKQFYVAMQLENAGLFAQAVKAYYATVVNFPKAHANTSWKTPWYVGPTALDSVSYLTRKHPELGMRLKGGKIRIRNRFDDDPMNDVFEIDPGRLVSASPTPKPEPRISLTTPSIQRQLGGGAVHLTQYANGHWQLFVDKTPFVVRGITYSPVPVGKSPDDASWVVHRDWMLADQNKNGTDRRSLRFLGR